MTCDCGHCCDACGPHDATCMSQEDRSGQPADPSDDYNR